MARSLPARGYYKRERLVSENTAVSKSMRERQDEKVTTNAICRITSQEPTAMPLE